MYRKRNVFPKWLILLSPRTSCRHQMGIAISFLSLSTRGWFTIRALWLQQNWYFKKRIYIFLRSNSEKCFAFVTVWEVIFLISARGTLAWKKISKVLRYVNVPGKCNALGSLDKNVAFKKSRQTRDFCLASKSVLAVSLLEEFFDMKLECPLQTRLTLRIKRLK